MLRGSLEVSEFEPRQVTPDAVPPDHPYESEDLLSRLRLEHRTLTSCAAALAVLALHALFIVPVMWGVGSTPNLQAVKFRGDSTALQWVVLEDSLGSSAVIRRPSSRSPTWTPINVTDVLPKLPHLPAEASDSGSGQSDGQAGRGALYGRYLGQIRARIDRAWLRPRTAIGAPIFACQVQMDQDRVGRVLAITLVECNGGTRWQLSLVHAIEMASPLPAPPTPAVFVRHVLLTFRAIAFSSGASAQLYEPPSALRASYGPEKNDALSQDAFHTLDEAVRAHAGKVLEVRIEGSKVEVEPERN